MHLKTDQHMRLNKYIRNGEVQVFPEDEIWGRMTFLFGEEKYDPRIRDVSYGSIDGFPMPIYVAHDQIGQANELVFHIAGAQYYPTRNGYVRVEG